MAHEIHAHDTLVLSKQKAWHGLGNVVPNDIPIEDGLRLSGLDWNVILSNHLEGHFEKIDPDYPNHESIINEHYTTQWKMVVREDTEEVFHVATVNYTPFQNSELFTLAQELSDSCDVGKLTIESAGSIYNGRRVWVLLKGGGREIKCRTPDAITPYIMLANSHDGTIALTGLPTWIRVVCNNTFSAALRSRSPLQFRFRHTKNMLDRINEMKAMVSSFNDTIDDDTAVLDSMAKRSMSRDEIQSLWTDVLLKLEGDWRDEKDHDIAERRKTKVVHGLSRMARVFDLESQQFGANLYVAMNAMTNWIEHGRGTLTGDARVNARLFGKYRESRDVAVNHSLAMVTA